MFGCPSVIMDTGEKRGMLGQPPSSWILWQTQGVLLLALCTRLTIILGRDLCISLGVVYQVPGHLLDGIVGP